MAIVLVVLLLPVKGAGLPLYLDWHSSYSYLYYDFLTDHSLQIKDVYNVHFGIDTLMTDNVRTKLDLKNQEKELISQVVIDHAMIDYQSPLFGLQLSMEDYGYGNGFFLYNRRNDDTFYSKNRLFNYRWHGIGADVKYKGNQLGIGIGNNNVNYTISEERYSYQNEYLKLKAFRVYVPTDNQFNIPVYHYGTEFSISSGKINLHTAYAYSNYPKSKYFPKMESNHLINELGVRISPNAGIILSSDLKTIPENNNEELLNEIALDFNYKKLQSYIGVNQKKVLNEKAYTYFTDINWQVVHSLTLGFFFDHVDFTKSKSYSRIGIQSSYYWNK